MDQPSKPAARAAPAGDTRQHLLRWILRNEADRRLEVKLAALRIRLQSDPRGTPGQ